MPNGLGFAKALRRSMTDAERLIWMHLRAGRFGEWKFRRQVQLGPHIVDFVCFRARLIVELDGGQHVEHAPYDAAPTDWVAAQGLRVIRFWNDDVLSRTDDVLAAIRGIARPLSPTPRSSPRYPRGRSAGRRMRRHFPPHPRGERGLGLAKLRACGKLPRRSENAGCAAKAIRPMLLMIAN